MPHVSTSFNDKTLYYFIHSFDGQIYQPVGDSTNYHRYTYGIANYRGNALTTGSFSPANKKTEILDMTTMTWSDADDYPFTST